jgi:hypothetical protein
MVLVRKHRAGSDSYGHVWAHDGDTVEVPYGHAVELLAIGDAGFTIVEPEQEPSPELVRTEVDEAPPPVTRRRGRPPLSRPDVVEE